VKESGRYDRVKTVGGDDYVDNGANSVINTAIRWLDLHVERADNVSREIVLDVPAGTYFVACDYARTIEAVWASVVSTSVRSQLTHRPYTWLRQEYPADWSTFTAGSPLYWSHSMGRLAPDSIGQDYTGAVDYQDTFRGSDAGAGLRGIVIMPAPSEAVVLNVFGLFYSKTLSFDTDLNWWTVRFPELVKLTCNYIEEGRLSNRSGMEDWLAAAQTWIVGIEMDAVAEEAEQIRGFEE
jgi:hypothetical protein